MVSKHQLSLFETVNVYAMHKRIMEPFILSCRPGSVVGIATGYGMDGPGIAFRWGARFSAPVPTGPGAHQPPVQWVPGLSRG